MSHFLLSVALFSIPTPPKKVYLNSHKKHLQYQLLAKLQWNLQGTSPILLKTTALVSVAPLYEPLSPPILLNDSY